MYWQVTSACPTDVSIDITNYDDIFNSYNVTIISNGVFNDSYALLPDTRYTVTIAFHNDAGTFDEHSYNISK